MAPFHVRSKVYITPIHVRSKFADFAPHMDGSHADFALHMEGSHADFAPHMERRLGSRNQQIAKTAISATQKNIANYTYIKNLNDPFDHF